MANATIDKWTISLDLEFVDKMGMSDATFGVQLAGVSTAARIAGVNNKTQSNLPDYVAVSGQLLAAWIIP